MREINVTNACLRPLELLPPLPPRSVRDSRRHKDVTLLLIVYQAGWCRGSRHNAPAVIERSETIRGVAPTPPR
jgi:hypothetical protein